MKRISVFLVACLLVSCVASYAAAGLSECIDASCRISHVNAKGETELGSGCVYHVDDTSVWIVTNAHVVGQDSVVDCEFWHAGHKSAPMQATVAYRQKNNDVDAAILSIPKAAFGGMIPPAIPFAPASHVVRPGETVMSVGCANGAWQTAWRGHATGYVGSNLTFTPPPAQGRSGSAIFNADGTAIVGLLYARSQDDTVGHACSRQALYQHLKLATTGGCRDGRCPIQLQWPITRPKPQVPPQQARPYPTLPTPTPAPPRVDLAPIVNQLDGNAQLMTSGFDRLATILEKQQEVITRPVVPVERPAEEQEATAADTLKEEIGEVVANVASNRMVIGGVQDRVETVAQAVLATDKAVDALGVDVAKETGTLRERLHARIEDAKAEGAEGAKEIAKVVVWDVLKGNSLWVMGALGILLFFIRKDVLDKVQNGDPLFVEKVASRLRGKVQDHFAADAQPPTQPPAS